MGSEFLLLLQLLTEDYCKTEPEYNFNNCVNEVMDCALDGEDLSWCVDQRKGIVWF